MLKTKVVHSKTKTAWNVVNTKLGARRKIATVPYVKSEDEDVLNAEKQFALKNAAFISFCFDNIDSITNLIAEKQC